MFSSLDILAERRDMRRQPGVALGVLHDSGFYLPNLNHGCIVPVYTGDSEIFTRTLFRGSQVPTSINYGRVQRWLSRCQNLHPKSCGLKQDTAPNSLKLIDCLTRKIVRMDDAEYFALSYVW